MAPTLPTTKKGRLALGTVLVLLVLLIWRPFGGNGVTVRAAEATRETIVNTISTNGKVEPADNFQAHAPMATTVLEISVREGDAVRAGQRLLRLNDADARAQAAAALAKLRAAEADLAAVRSGGTREEVLVNTAELTRARSEVQAAQRQLESLRKLQATGAASAAEVSEAENRLRRAQAALQLQEQRRTRRFSTPEIARVEAAAAEARAAYAAAHKLVSDANVTAPRAGVAYSVPVREGSFVNPGELLVQVADLTKLQVRAFVDEPEIGRLQQGQQVSITWDALPGRTWEGVLTRVPSTVTQRGTRNVGEIVVDVSNGDRKLLPNVNVNVAVTTAKIENAITVPREAVHDDGNGKRYVFRVENGKLVRTAVKTAMSNLTRIQVTEGLPEKALVAVGSVTGHSLSDGLEVAVQRQ